METIELLAKDGCMFIDNHRVATACAVTGCLFNTLYYLYALSCYKLTNTSVNEQCTLLLSLCHVKFTLTMQL